MSKQKIDPDAGGPWDVGMERVPLVRLEGNEVHIENFRNFRYEHDGSHEENYESRTIKIDDLESADFIVVPFSCLLYTSPSPRDRQKSRMPSSA